ncbi:uncharacterized protein LOC135208446 isoform X1 [Macrobrachium nipponense]|uniref:uncharacterized protein LOC135208446 isoform X1 n=2 Tax=Macrobrachium nipponense TaxID=159736 RepID=UPI0030C8491D
MTVGLKEGEDLPEELKPIMPGGSWFDDMAVKRLQRKHHDLKEHGKLEGHKHEEDAEEMFIMSKLGASHPMVSIPEVGAPVTIPIDGKQDTREVMRNFLRQHTHHSHELREKIHSSEEHDDDDGRPKAHRTSHEFMVVYERELENFFKNFMSAMLQAEVRGVSIETRSDDDADRPNGVDSS